MPFPGRIYLFAVIFGIGLGGDNKIIPLMAGDLFGIKTLGRIMGIILVEDELAESFMPMLVEALYMMNNSFTLGFSVLITIAVTGAIVIIFLEKGNRRRYKRAVHQRMISVHLLINKFGKIYDQFLSI